MTELVRYDAARHALAEAHRVDEVKSSATKRRRCKSTPSRPRTLSCSNTRRKSGSALSAEQARCSRRAESYWSSRIGKQSRSAAVAARNRTATETFADLGVTKTQSSKWQKLAALPEDKFEIRVAHAKARVENMTTSAPSNSKDGIYRRKRMVHAGGIRREGARDSREDRSRSRIARPCPEDSARRHVLHRC